VLLDEFAVLLSAHASTVGRMTAPNQNAASAANVTTL
jgi:hypothetical protein